MATLISGSTGVNKITDGTIAVADFASGARGGTTNISKWDATEFTASGVTYPITSWTGALISGTNMSESSGVFTFPETGIWEVSVQGTFYKSDTTATANENSSIRILWSNNGGSSYDYTQDAQTAFDSPGNDWWRMQVYTKAYIDVTSTSNFRVNFRAYVYGNDALYTRVGGGTGGAWFRRIGDT